MSISSFVAKRLRAERSARFWREIVPYLRYVMASGMLGFTIFAIVGLYAYSEWVKQIPPGQTAVWAFTLAFTPFIAISPVRTFLRQADLAFLLPLEARMDGYFSSCLRSAFVTQSVLIGAVWLLLWPMFRTKAGAGHMPYEMAVIYGELLLLKGLQLLFSWKIRQFREKSHRLRFEALRWPMTAGLLYAVAAGGPAWSLLLIGIVGISYSLALRLPPAHSVHWEHLIRLEQSHRSKYFSFIGVFVDVPREQPPASTNKLAPWFARVFASGRSGRNNPFRYLYALTWSRSELFGITVRLTVLGVLLIAWISGDGIKAAVYVLFVYMLGLQLHALKQYHVYSDWMFVYPLTEGQRTAAAAGVVRSVHVSAAMLLAVPLLATVSRPAWFAIALAACGAILFAAGRLRAFVKRKQARL
ncbi:ABC transporter permease [Paenibacillus hamazuiensis]|uniref:ABC transporter permease n=1 Tax=Paenibacillus hamazuiensis TaxID=2936508 RepID=UPI00200C7ACE|nr:ABC transporter permease [Paenibacillus hamazuiensis]